MQAVHAPFNQNDRAKYMINSIEGYFASVPENRKSKIEALHKLITELFPQASVEMKYKMPTYRVDEGWVAIANQKNYISLYTCGYHHIERFKEKYPKIKTGKGCINFRDRDTLPLKDISDVVKHAINHPKGSPP